jgi:hypothetical protein
MSEERSAGDLSGARSSSLKIGVMVAAVASGVALLLCGGVAGYVAWTGAPPPDEAVLSSSASREELAEESQRIRSIARQILEIEIPVGFEPLSGDAFSSGRQVVFGRRSHEGALLKLSQMDPPAMQGGPSGPPVPDHMLMQMAERGGELTSSKFAEVDQASVSSRELTILGSPATFHFVPGKRTIGGKNMRKVGGAFTLGSSRIALIYTIPEEEYDEEAVVRMIESIQAPEGDAVNRSAPSSESEPTTNGPQEDSPKRELGPSETRSPDDAPP